MENLSIGFMEVLLLAWMLWYTASSKNVYSPESNYSMRMVTCNLVKDGGEAFDVAISMILLLLNPQAMMIEPGSIILGTSTASRWSSSNSTSVWILSWT